MGLAHWTMYLEYEEWDADLDADALHSLALVPIERAPSKAYESKVAKQHPYSETAHGTGRVTGRGTGRAASSMNQRGRP